VLWRILWASRPVVNRLMEVLDAMNEHPGVDPGDFEISVWPRDEAKLAGAPRDGPVPSELGRPGNLPR
jgi:hypothetical protein